MCMIVALPCQQVTDNKSCILPCLIQKLENHRQQIVHLLMPRADASKKQTTNRTSLHASSRYQQVGCKKKKRRGNDLLRALGSAACDITHEIGDTICDITHEPRVRFVAVLFVCRNTKKQYIWASFLTLKTL